MNIDEYADLAKEKNGFKSDRQLSKNLGFSGNSVSYWRRGMNFPSDDMMMKLAKLAGVDTTTALIDLNVWRTDGETQKAYQGLSRRMASFLSLALVACATLFISIPPQSSDFSELQSPAPFQVSNNNIYYGN